MKSEFKGLKDTNRYGRLRVRSDDNSVIIDLLDGYYVHWSVARFDPKAARKIAAALIAAADAAYGVLT